MPRITAKRRAELMRRVGGKSAQLVERGLEARERVVDDRRRAVRFRRADSATVRRSCNRSAVMRLGLRRQTIDRRERSAREDVPADAGQDHDQRQTEHEDDQHFPELTSQPLL